jgi:hypothetical protein
MSADWQPGDLALCVKVGAPKQRVGYVSGHAKIRPGGIYVVEHVVSWFGVFGLVIQNHHSAHPTRAWLSEGFRKIPPLTDEEREQFAADLNVREPAHV